MMGAMATQSPFEYSAKVNQAAGIVSVQANCTIEHAFALMFERAESAGVWIDDIATAVLDHFVLGTVFRVLRPDRSSLEQRRASTRADGP
jgi:hypothetical protein